MILPDGYSDIPARKIAAVVTNLEMTERPAMGIVIWYSKIWRES
jgi:hypothetical protein